MPYNETSWYAKYEVIWHKQMLWNQNEVQWQNLGNVLMVLFQYVYLRKYSFGLWNQFMVFAMVVENLWSMLAFTRIGKYPIL